MKEAQMAALEHMTGDVYRVGCDIERELNEAQDRIKRLEDALDTLTLVVGLTPIRGNLAALQEAMDESRAVLKAKEDKL
jgi:hypothetical protein